MPLNPTGLDVKVADQESGQQAALQVQAVRQREDVRVPGLGPQVFHHNFTISEVLHISFC